MSLPNDLDGLTVTASFGRFTGAANPSLAPLTGVVTFRGRRTIRHLGGGVLVVPTVLKATVDPATGFMSQFLPVTNDPDYVGTNDYDVTFALTDPGGATLTAQPDPFTLSLDIAYTASTVDLFTGVPLTGSSGVTLVNAFATALLLLAQTPDLLVSGTVVSDSHGAAISAPITWPDGVVGTYTGVASTAFPGLVDSYVLTYGQRTYTQPAVTRNAAGSITAVPSITVI